MGAMIGVFAVFAIGIAGAYWWNHTEEKKHQERARLVFAGSSDRRYRHPSIMTAARPVVERPPVLAGAPVATIDPDNDAAIEHHAAEGIAAAQYMLDKLWKQKGHDK